MELVEWLPWQKLATTADCLKDTGGSQGSLPLPRQVHGTRSVERANNNFFLRRTYFDTVAVRDWTPSLIRLIEEEVGVSSAHVNQFPRRLI